jgi:hypothetical protein
MANANKTVASAQGAANASEPWIAAQLAITRLERTIEPGTSALGGLDEDKRLLMLSAPQSPDMALLDDAIAELTRLTSIQTAEVRNLAASLNR